MSKFVSLFFVAALCLSVASCKKENDPGKTSLDVSMTVTDTYAYDDIQVRINTVEFDTAAGRVEWSPMPLTDSLSRPVNMHTLRHGNFLLLSTQELPPVRVKGLRIRFAPQASIVKDGRTYPLTIPADLVETGRYIPLDLSIKAGTQQSLWITWNTSRSIQAESGNNTYVFNPQFRIFDPNTTGGVEGYVKPDAAMPYITVYTDTVANPNAAVKFNETTIPYTAGYFKLVGVPEGTYKVRAGSSNGSYPSKEIGEVRVVKKQTRNIGTITL